MNGIQSEVILASAGTGKTHALTSRILRLLALGVDPGAILALTFTRKAAGEFSSVVFRRLAAAAGDEAASRRLAGELGIADAGPARFLALLTLLIDRMDRLQFRTFDAFFQRVVGAMPLDLGLPGGVRMLDEIETVEARNEVLRRLLAAEADPAAQEALLTAYRDATWGAEEKGLRRRLEQWISGSHSKFLECRDVERWGSGIWSPEMPPWLDARLEERDAEVVESWALPQDGEVFRSLESIAVQARKWQPGMKLPTGRIFEQLLEQVTFGADGPLTLTYRKKIIEVDGEVAAALRRLIAGFVGGSIRRHLRITAGIHQVLEPFDMAYHEGVRLRGRLAFADVVEMLRRIPAIEWQARLDARIDHWLFDEFQDTSVQQWAVVENLVDEVLQDDSGRRSAFFVGDPKQSIYRWRGGEHRLIERILEHYGGRIVERALVKSFRSDPAVIELVNRFGSFVANPACGLPEPVVKEWTRFWKTHESASKDRKGHATVRHLETRDALANAVLTELRRIAPMERGFSCAILVRDNDQARRLAGELRERGFLRVTSETDEKIATDAPVNRALLALIAAVAHPADTASAAIVGMTPLRVLLEDGDWTELRRWFFGRVTAGGLEGALRATLGRLPEITDDFCRGRLKLLLDLARKHDVAGGSMDDFLRLATAHGRRPSASADNVQILTIHRAKGLGFDVVLLPVLDATRIDSTPREGFLSMRGETLDTLWLLHRPTAALCEIDERLLAAHRQQVCDAAYDELCVWYVALTRARHALHVFTVPPGKSDGPSPVALLRRSLGIQEPQKDGLLWEEGDAGWIDGMRPMADGSTK